MKQLINFIRDGLTAYVFLGLIPIVWFWSSVVLFPLSVKVYFTILIFNITLNYLKEIDKGNDTNNK